MSNDGDIKILVKRNLDRLRKSKRIAAKKAKAKPVKSSSNSIHTPVTQIPEIVLPTTITSIITPITIPQIDNSNTIRKKRVITPLKKYTNRQIAVKTLLDNSNLSQREIGETLNYSTSNVKRIKEKLDTMSIVSPQTLRLAHKTLKNKMKQVPIEIEKVINGEVVKINDYPSHAVALDAAKRVIDQHEPIIQRHESLSLNLSADAGDWDGYDKFRRKE